MSGGISMGDGGMIARGLKFTRTTNLVVVSVTAAVASNAAVAIQFTSMLGQVVLAGLIFATVSVGIWAVSVDLYSRANQTISNMRSIGATSGSVSRAVVGPIIIYSAAGSGLGGVVGTLIGLGLGSTVGFGLAAGLVMVVASSSVAAAAGVYLGVRAAWRR